MADVNIQLGYKNTAWFIANATHVLLEGQTVYLAGNTTIYKRGDGATQLQNLQWSNAEVQSHISNTSNPHEVTAAQVGLGNVDNTSDANKPVSIATQAALDLKQDTLTFTPEDSANKGQPNGYASLGSDGKIPSSELPAIALTDVFVVNSQAAQLALVAEEGDVAVRTDLPKTYIHNGGTSGTMSDWQEMLTPTDTVLSVNGQTGAVNLTTTNISEGTNLYFTVARAIGSALTGFAAAASRTPITALDSILIAFGKVQKYLNDQGDAAFKNTGTTTGTVAAGDDTRFADARSRKIFSHQNTDYTHTGDVNEVVMTSLALPIMSANDRAQLELQWGRVGSAANINFRLYVSANPGTPGNALPVGSTLAGTLTITGTQLIGGFERRLVNKNSVSLNSIYPATVSATTDLTANTAARVNLNINTSTQYYFIVTMQCLNAADTARLDNAQVYWDRA